MCSESRLMALVMLMAILVSCSPYGKIRQIRSGNVSVGLSVSDEEKIEEDDDKEVLIDSIRSSLSDEPIIMNAIRDTETGEMVATDVINASKVTARVRNVAERAG